MLAKRGDEGECKKERDRCAKGHGQQVPLASGRRIAQSPPAYSSNPDQDGAQAGYVEDRAETDDE
jgi:hypothetical protein